ncbi:MAG TPA: methyltransferase domain-containing protein [Gemmataceae bacterium]|jgi:SAM-dependent methyltransferase
MNQFINGLARVVTETVDCPAPILEIGSYQVAGQEELAELRSLFPGKPYLGVDMRPGPGVDSVADVEALPQRSASMGTVIALNTFEHVPHFWKGFAEVQRVLRPDGVFLVSCPFYFHIHSYPNDYWRFTPEAFKLLLNDFPNKIIGWQGPKTRPANVWALALGPTHPPLTPQQYHRFRELLGHYGREPLAPMRRLRYQVGRWISGRRPFSPYLDQARWETEWCRN